MISFPYLKRYMCASQSMVSYIHRIGRTGRAGKSGEAITLFTEDDIVRVCICVSIAMFVSVNRLRGLVCSLGFEYLLAR